MVKEKPIKEAEVEPSPTFPIIKDAGAIEMLLLVSTTKPAAECRLTGLGDIALADICENEWTTAKELKMSLTLIGLRSKGVPDTNEKVLAMTWWMGDQRH